MRLIIAGCMGRMGKTLMRVVCETEEATLTGGTVRLHEQGRAEAYVRAQQYGDVAFSDHIEDILSEAEGVVDFTQAGYTLDIAKACAEQNKVHIIGTTGLDRGEIEKISGYAAQTPIVLSPNMSVGVNILLSLVKQTATILNNDFDAEIYEMHHKHKKDAPSGTALGLGKAVASGRRVIHDDVMTLNREGIRESGAIGYSVARGGEVIGDHVVTFAGPGERIELAHKASSRDIYAHGAIRAALWASSQKPGLYSMQDVLGLNDNG